MTGTLLLTAALMGAAGMAHCAGMCSAGCEVAMRLCKPAPARRAQVYLLVGRLLGYSAAGAAAAAFAQVLRWSGTAVQWLHPVWAMLQVAVVMLGLFLLMRGRLPDGLVDWARHLGARPNGTASEWVHVRVPGEIRAVGLGLLWTALPCGLLQAALVLAALASSPAEGAAVMAAFSFTSLPGLLAGSAVWRWVSRRTGIERDRAAVLSLRMAGAGMAGVAAWPALQAVGAPLVAAWCA